MRLRAARGHRCLLGAETSSKESEHLLYLFCRIVLVSSKDIGFGTFGVTKFMNMGLGRLSKSPSLHRKA